MWEKATRFLLWPRDLFKGGLLGAGVAFGTVRWLSPVCSTGVIDLPAQLEALVLGKLWMPLQLRALPAPKMSKQRAVGLPPVLPVVPRACSARWLGVKFLVKLSW